MLKKLRMYLPFVNAGLQEACCETKTSPLVAESTPPVAVRGHTPGHSARARTVALDMLLSPANSHLTPLRYTLSS